MKPSSLCILLVGGTAVTVCAFASLASMHPMFGQENNLKRFVIPTAGFAFLATTAVAQAPALPPPATAPAPPPAAAPWGQQIDVSGIVKEFALTPVGDIEGIILTNGTEIHVPPHLTSQVAAAMRPGEAVAVRGWGTGVPNFVVATALTGQRGQSVMDQGPPPPGTMPPPPASGAPGAQQATVQGRVQQDLHGPRGDVNGAMLDEGTTLKLPPPMAWQLASLLQPGQSVTAQGWVLSNSNGRVVDVQAIGATPAQLTQVAPPPGGPAAPGVAPPPPPAPGFGAAPPPPPPAPPAPPATR